MNQQEVVETLLAQAKIEPDFTELVWQKLEEENGDFFKAYYLRLVVKHQIMEFNKLLEQQVQLMHQINPTRVASIPTSNGSQLPPLYQNSSCFLVEQARCALRSENIQIPIGSGLPNAFTNGRSSLHPSMRSAPDISAHANRINASTNMVATQSSNLSLMQGINGSIKCEAVHTDISSFGYLGQIPRNFSLSDLTADFSQSSDILENYVRSPFLVNEHFLDSREREHPGDSRLDTISEGASYDV
ncbi:hypothetical protein LINPERPRIM_LOCUS37743 [Linum perenne]